MERLLYLIWVLITITIIEILFKRLGDGMMKIEEEELTKQVFQYILGLGIPAHLKGYQYLKTAIILGITDPSFLKSFTKKLYPAVAKQHQANANNVERAIRGSIEYAWKYNQSKINAFRGYVGTKKPVNSEFISLIVQNMILIQRIKM